MCGRYAATASPGELVEEFEMDVDRTAEPTRSVLVSAQEPPAGTPDYNMAPTKQAPVVLTRVPREAREGPSSASSACSPGASCRAGRGTPRVGRG